MQTYEVLTLTISSLAILMSTSCALFTVMMSKKISSSGFKAKESLKTDTATLLASMRSIMHKTIADKGQGIIDFEAEKNVVRKFVNSQTGFAYYSWIDQAHKKAGDKPEGWRIFFLRLSEISTCNDIRPAGTIAAEIETLFDTISEDDFKKLSDHIADLSTAIRSNSENRAGNTLIDSIVKAHKDQDSLGSSSIFIKQLEQLKNKGIKDPQIDLFLAAINGDEQMLSTAIESGANIHMTDKELLKQYQNELHNSF